MERRHAEVRLVNGPAARDNGSQPFQGIRDRDVYPTTFHEPDHGASPLEAIVGEAGWHGQYIGGRQRQPRPPERRES